MAQKFTPVWDDWIEVTQELNAQEKGRLIDAIVMYSNGGDWQELIKGNERYVFPSFRTRLDRWQEVSAAKAAAGQSGGRQAQANSNRLKQKETDPSGMKQTQADSSSRGQAQADLSSLEQVKVDVKAEDIDEGGGGTAGACCTPFGDIVIDPVIAAIQKELSGLTDDHYDDLEAFRKELSDDLIIEAVNEAVAHGVRTWAYVRTILSAFVREQIKTVGEARARRVENVRGDKHHDAKGRAGGGRAKVDYSYLRGAGAV